jgi:hypothetical protein
MLSDRRRLLLASCSIVSEILMTDAAMWQYNRGLWMDGVVPPHLLDAEAPYVHARVEYLDVTFLINKIHFILHKFIITQGNK